LKLIQNDRNGGSPHPIPLPEGEGEPELALMPGFSRKEKVDESTPLPPGEGEPELALMPGLSGGRMWKNLTLSLWERAG